MWQRALTVGGGGKQVYDQTFSTVTETVYNLGFTPSFIAIQTLYTGEPTPSLIVWDDRNPTKYAMNSYGYWNLGNASQAGIYSVDTANGVLTLTNYMKQYATQMRIVAVSV